MIWNAPFTAQQLNTLPIPTLMQQLGIEIIEVADDAIYGTMPVDHRTHQPAGLLHGGASAALAETLGSIASWMVIDRTQFDCVGLELNINHVRGKRSGVVTGKATPIHMGRSTHIWNIEITDEEGKLVAISRLTMAIIAKSK